MARRSYYMGAHTRYSAPKGTSEDDTRSVTEGIAKTGQVSKQGTVTHTEHRSGAVDANVRPRPVVAKLKVER